MRILLAPDDFTGTLDAPAVARAMAEGWRSRRPHDEVLQRPMSDGGPGFVRSIAACHDVSVRTARVSHALGAPIDAAWCMVGDTAYLESAQVLGIERGFDVYRASSYGLGQMLCEAIDAGARRVVVGLGGTMVNDGGAGLLAALGARAQDANGRDLDLRQGLEPLRVIAALETSPALERVRGVELIIASDVDVPLLGPRGAAHGFARQKGAEAEALDDLESIVSGVARACGRRADGKNAAVMLGAGAAGGVGFALLHLGAERRPGIGLVWDESDIALLGIDLVITGEGALDWQSMHGKVVSGVALRAQAAGVPCIAIAGRVEITPRERAEMGLDATYALVEMVGSEVAVSQPASAVASVTARIVNTWGVGIA